MRVYGILLFAEFVLIATATVVALGYGYIENSISAAVQVVSPQVVEDSIVFSLEIDVDGQPIVVVSSTPSASSTIATTAPTTATEATATTTTSAGTMGFSGAATVTVPQYLTVTVSLPFAFTIPSLEVPASIGLNIERPGIYSPSSLLVLALFLGIFIMYSKVFGWAQALAVASAISLAISIALLGYDLVAFFLVLLVLGLALWRALGK